MKAYVRVIYSSEGGSPGQVERVLRENGFRRLKEMPVFETELQEGELASKLEGLHESLRGLEVRYIPSTRPPSEIGSMEGMGSREKLESLRPLGIDVDDLIDVLERDPEQFKERALEVLRTHLDRIATEMERELKEAEAKRRLEEAKERILEEVRAPEGRTFHELAAVVRVDPSLLSEMLDEMVEKGMIAPEQRGRKVVFRAE